MVSVSRVEVVPHLMWMGPSRWMSQSNMAKDAIIVATSQMAVSSMPPTYPPKMGICSIMMTSPLAPQPASMFRPVMSIFISLSWEHSCASKGFIPYMVRSDDSLPVADSGVWGPYMHIPGRCDIRHASRT